MTRLDTDGLDTDVLVAGGGPVGLAVAVLARRAGHEVVLVEPRSDPVDKACGEGLMPGAVAALAALGVDPPGTPIRGIRYLQGAAAVEADFRAGPGRGVRRTTLHRALATAADAAGVKRVTGRVGQVDQGAGWVRAVVDGGPLRSRWLLAADGLHSPVRRGLGLERGPGRRPVRTGLRRHYALAPWTDYVEVHWAPDAEAYVTPVEDGLVGVAVLTRRGRSYDETLRSFPRLTERLDGIPAVGAVRGAGPLRQRVARRAHGRVLLVGDAAGYVDALTGEGIAVGLRTAAAAVGCLTAEAPERYDAQWRRASRRYRLLTEAVLAASSGPLRPALVPAARRLPGVFAAVVNALA